MCLVIYRNGWYKPPQMNVEPSKDQMSSVLPFQDDAILSHLNHQVQQPAIKTKQYKAKVSHYIIAFIPTMIEINWSQHTSLGNLLQCLWQNLLYMYEKKFKRLLCRRNWMEHRWFLLENILSKSMNPSVFFFSIKNKSWNDFTFLLAKQNKVWNNNCFNYVTWRYASIDFSHCSLFSANEARFL